jgi:hypothetical protein
MLMAGGAFGTVLVVVGAKAVAEQSLVFLLPMLFIAILFGWAAFTGLCLWQGTAYGWKWASILFASQIPTIAMPGATYQWFTGVYFGPALRFGPDTSEAVFSANLGATGQFFVGTSTGVSIFGLNLFAVIALLFLMRSKKTLENDTL